MNILIRQVKVIDPQAPLHHQIFDIHIVSGRIEAIGTDLPTSENQDTIAVPGLCVSPGWVDPFAYFGDPGFEFKETLETGTAAAAAGGYTEVFSLPNTAPVVHNKLAVDYVVQKAK